MTLGRLTGETASQNLQTTRTSPAVARPGQGPKKIAHSLANLQISLTKVFKGRPKPKSTLQLHRSPPVAQNCPAGSQGNRGFIGKSANSTNKNFRKSTDPDTIRHIPPFTARCGKNTRQRPNRHSRAPPPLSQRRQQLKTAPVIKQNLVKLLGSRNPFLPRPCARRSRSRLLQE